MSEKNQVDSREDEERHSKKHKHHRRSRSRSNDRKERKRHHRDEDRDRHRRHSRSPSNEKRPRDDRGRDRRDRSPDRREETSRKIVLADILRDNPGISMPDAIQRLHAINVANAGVDETMLTMSHNAIANTNASTGIIGVGGAATKAFREIYVGNLPPSVTVAQLIDFMNAAIKQLGSTSGRGAVVSAWVSADGHYGFTEFSTIEECNAAIMYINGLQMGSAQLKIGRPSGFKAVPNMNSSTGGLGVGSGGLSSLVSMLGANGTAAFSGGLGSIFNPSMASTGGMYPAALGVGAERKPEYANVILLSNLPLVLETEQLRELVSAFGELAAFNVMTDTSAQCKALTAKFQDASVTQMAMEGLRELPLGDAKLTAQLVPPSMVHILLQSLGELEASAKEQRSEGEQLASLPPSTVLRLDNVNVEEDLVDDALFEEMVEDVAGECNKHGTVRAIEAPRRGDGRGVVFIQFTSIEGAVKARAEVEGCTFNGSAVMVHFFPAELFQDKVFVLPENYATKKPKEALEEMD